MAKQEYEGIAFTSSMSPSGWQVSVTARANTPSKAVADLEATVAMMQLDGYVPFVTQYNKAVSVVDTPKPAGIDASATVVPAQPEGFAPVDSTPGLSVVGQAQELGGVVVAPPPGSTVESWVTPAQPAQAPIPDPEIRQAVADNRAEIDNVLGGISPYDDGTNFLGELQKKPLVADCLLGDSYEIMADSFVVGDQKIEFFNTNSQYACVTQSLKGHGGKVFSDIFPGWQPEVGSHGPINPVILYVVGEGETNQGNAWQNLKNARQA